MADMKAFMVYRVPYCAGNDEHRDSSLVVRTPLLPCVAPTGPSGAGFSFLRAHEQGEAVEIGWLPIMPVSTEFHSLFILRCLHK